MNRDAYNRISALWDAARTKLSPPEQRYLDAFLEGLDPGSTIIDAGCATGRPVAEYVIARGYRILGIDQSEALLARASARFPNERWIHAALETYPFEEPCHGVICWDALFHIEREHHRTILERMACSVRTGGRIVLTAGGSEHPPFTDTMFGETFFYDSHPPHTVLRMLRELGFLALIGEFIDLPTGGRDKGRYAIVARKA